MGDAIGEMLPSAVGIAISPLPIIGVVLILVSDRAKVNGIAFVLGAWLSIALLGGIILVAAGGADASDDSQPATWLSILKALLGAAMLLLAVKQWRSKPAEGAEVQTPAWMQTIAGFSALKSAGFASIGAALNPKNLLLVISGATAIAQTGISGGQQAIALVVFVLIASIGATLPVVVYFLMGERSRGFLDGLKDWMARNSAVIMTVILLILGVKLLGDALSELS